jgi:hypothetical protein
MGLEMSMGSGLRRFQVRGSGFQMAELAAARTSNLEPGTY